MATLVEVKAYYDKDPDALFRDAMNFGELQEAMRGIAVYEGLTDGPARVGDTYTADVTFFGFWKTKGHVIHVEALDCKTRILQSREHNPSIQRWDHQISVQPENGTTCWTDSIIIDAGWQTFGAARFASFIYQRRHRYRKALKITMRREPTNA